MTSLVVSLCGSSVVDDDGVFLPELVYESLCDLATEDTLAANELSRQTHGHVCLGIELDDQIASSPIDAGSDARRRRKLLLWAQVTLDSTSSFEESLDLKVDLIDYDAYFGLPPGFLGLVQADLGAIPCRISLAAPAALHKIVLRPAAHGSSIAAQLLRDEALMGDTPWIFRQGTTWTPAGGGDCEILMTEPGVQGFITQKTQVAVLASATTSGDNLASSTTFSGRLSTLGSNSDAAPFNTDSFLTASLGLDESDEEDEEDFQDPDRIQIGGSSSASSQGSSSLSASSGSLTPRPSTSPVANGQAWLDRERENEHNVASTTQDRSQAALPRIVTFHAQALQRQPLSARARMKRKATAADDDIVDGDDDEATCWLSMAGLARAGVFAGDWVLLAAGSGREVLARVEMLHEWQGEVGSDTIWAPPQLLSKLPTDGLVEIKTIPSGRRTPDLPTAKSITFARVLTPRSVLKRYDDAVHEGLQRYFEDRQRLVRTGDVIGVAVPDISEDSMTTSSQPRYLEYFVVRQVASQPLKPLDEDFVASVSSRCRSGELGCWMDSRRTRVEVMGSEHLPPLPGSKSWWGIPRRSRLSPAQASESIRRTLAVALTPTAAALGVHVPILVTGARGSGKTTLVAEVADLLGIHLLQVDAYNLLGETPVKTEGALLAVAERAKSCSPCILLLSHVDAVGGKAGNPQNQKETTVLHQVSRILQSAFSETGHPAMLLATTTEEDKLALSSRSVFKQLVEIKAPNESERLRILEAMTAEIELSPDVDLSDLARQTAALQLSDLANLVAMTLEISDGAVTRKHVSSALDRSRALFSDSIGAPKIPNVSWSDVGGLSSVKADILDTIQLPLERPDLFASGLKKRSGILLYGPPGTGKTLLAKAVATSCSLNFFSVKGPELLNMYIGESEANVRRVFQRARDAQPCVIFMDELDSVAPKRGNQGDSGGVMDRIVSQLLAELDGMGDGDGGPGVFVMAATNRPDLLDPALLRPGRFDRMLYLSVATTHEAQYDILEALTRKFDLGDDVNLREIADRCPFNYTGADFYALCSDAMLKAMTRIASDLDNRIAEMNALGPATAQAANRPYPMTPQYYLSELAASEETDVVVKQQDFEAALAELSPSVSQLEMEHYARVQQQFAKETLNSKAAKPSADGETAPVKKNKGKGKAIETNGHDHTT